MTKRTKRPKKDKKGQNGQKRPKKDKNAKRGQKDKRGQRGQKRTKEDKKASYSNVHFRPIYLSASSSLLPRFIFGPQDPGFEFRSQLHGNKLVKLRRGSDFKKPRSQTNSSPQKKSRSIYSDFLEAWFVNILIDGIDATIGILMVENGRTLVFRSQSSTASETGLNIFPRDCPWG